MDDISTDKLSELLNSPDLLKNVQSVIEQIGGFSSPKPDIIVDEAKSAPELNSLDTSSIINSISSLLSNNKAERIALLLALKPFLSAEKQAMLDSVLYILKAANLFLGANILK